MSHFETRYDSDPLLFDAENTLSPVSLHPWIIIRARIPHLAQTSDAVNRQLSCFSSRYMNLLAVFQI